MNYNQQLQHKQILVEFLKKLYLIKDTDSQLYIGGHSQKFAQLQVREYASEFTDYQKAQASVKLLKNLPLKLEIVEEDKTQR